MMEAGKIEVGHKHVKINNCGLSLGSK